MEGTKIDFLGDKYFFIVIGVVLHLHTKFQIFLTKLKILQNLGAQCDDVK